MTQEPQAALVHTLWGPALAPEVLMATLAQLGLLGVGGHPAARGFAAYREHAKALAVRALGAAYPRVQSWIGAADFPGLAWQFARQHPPDCGDLGRWGAELPDVLLSIPDMEPELPALARLDWALHQLLGAADEAPASDLLEQLQRGVDAPLRLSQSMTFLHLPPSAWAVAAAASAPTWEQAGEGLLVWRTAWQPRWAALPAGWADWLQHLAAGQTLGDAFEHTLRQCPDFDPGRALHAALQQAWILDLAE